MWPFTQSKKPARSAGWSLNLFQSSAGPVMANPSFFGGVRILTQSLASLPWVVYMRDGDQRERAAFHPTYTVLKRKPNPWQTPFDFFQYLFQSLLLDGNFFAIKDYAVRRYGSDIYRDVVGLIPVNPQAVKVTMTSTGEKRFEYAGQTLTDNDMLHIIGYSRDGIEGQSIVQYVGDAILAGKSARDYNWRFFDTGGLPSAVISTQHELDEEQIMSLKQSYIDAYSKGGYDRRGVLVLHSGFDLKPIGFKPEDLQLLDTLKLSDLDVCRILGIPPHLLGITDKATFASVEQQGLDFVRYTLRPWIVRVEQAMNVSLFETDRFFVEASVEGFLRGEIKTRYESYAVARQWGWMSVNEIRKLENMPPIPDGDIYLQPLNMKGARDDSTD